MDLSDCIPKDKHDLAAVRRAADVGFPALDPVLPELLEWLQDINWPVAQELVGLLAKAGPAIAPHVRAVLASDDDDWKWSLVRFCAGLAPVEIVRELSADLVRLASRPTAGERASEVDDAARDLLARLSSEDGGPA